MSQYCKVCDVEPLVPLWRGDAVADPGWARCLYCGSDSAARTYAEVARHYAPGYEHEQTRLGGGSFESYLDSLRSNLEWFGQPNAGDSFLDVGCCNGAALCGMRDFGWDVCGWDVVKYDLFDLNLPVCVGGQFSAGGLNRWLGAPLQFNAVLCREVVEHVEDWGRFLRECSCVTAPGGLFQIQTPRPCATPHPIPYQECHLQLFSPVALERALGYAGFRVVGSRFWEIGQAWLCRRG